MKDLNELAAEIHAANAHWWHDPATGARLDRNKGEMLMLIVSELAEAMEGERKNLMDDKLPHRKMAEVELADVLIRVFDFAGGFGYPLYEWPRKTRRRKNRAEWLFEMVNMVCDIGYGVRENDFDYTRHKLEFLITEVRSYATTFGYDVDGAMEEKRAFNAVRPDHKAEARLAANGKKF